MVQRNMLQKEIHFVKPRQMRAYLITNLINDKKYVGITSNSLKVRWKGHVDAAKKGSITKPICKAIVKYGKAAFKMEEIGRTENWDDLCKLEVALILQLNTFAPSGYNVTKGGDGTLGRRHNPDALRKIGLASKGKTVSEETRKKISKGHLGKKLSEEHKAKLAAAKLGTKRVPRTEEDRRKIADGVRRSWPTRRNLGLMKTT